MLKRFKILFIIVLVFGCSFILLNNIYSSKVLLMMKPSVIIDNYSPFYDCKNYKSSNKDRYLFYYKYHSDLSYQSVVNMVNINLDKNFFSFSSESDLTKNYLVLVNKYNYLRSDYVPDDLTEIDSKYFIVTDKDVTKLRREAKIQFEKLCEASYKNGTPIYGSSAYRSYSYQDKIYNHSLFSDGQSIADSDTARPGFSEHQTGLAIDVTSIKKGKRFKFSSTPSYKWLINNAHRFGFILRYPDGKQNIHGYVFESWHYRYVGTQVATDMFNNYKDLTYDEYYYMFVKK